MCATAVTPALPGLSPLAASSVTPAAGSGVTLLSPLDVTAVSPLRGVSDWGVRLSPLPRSASPSPTDGRRRVRSRSQTFGLWFAGM
jgi:hypothetical protein